MAKHIHKYQRVNIATIPDKEYWVMKCTIPGCTHYTAGTSKLSFPLLRGQIAICNKCENRFILDKRALRMANPTCADCVNGKKDDLIKSADDFFNQLEDEFIKGKKE